MTPRSFHSWQATSHALHPIQVDVSMYLETVGVSRIPDRDPQTEAEERRISRFCVLMAAPSRLLELDEEGLELRRPGIRVHRGGRQHVGEGPRVALLAGEAPV